MRVVEFADGDLTWKTVNEFQRLFGDAERFRVGWVKDDFRLIVGVISDVVLIDPLQVRPVSLIQGICLFTRIVLSPACISPDKMIEVKIDIPGDPVIEGALGFIEFAVVTPLPVFFEEFIYNFLF